MKYGRKMVVCVDAHGECDGDDPSGRPAGQDWQTVPPVDRRRHQTVSLPLPGAPPPKPLSGAACRPELHARLQ